jgi:hypothetical protein
VLAYALGRAAWAVMLCLILSLFTFVIFYVVPRGSSRSRRRGGLGETWPVPPGDERRSAKPS